MLSLLIAVLLLPACATDAPRAVPHDDPRSLSVAGGNFARIRTVRVQVESSGAVASADVQLPDALRVRAAGAEYIVIGADVWRLGGSQAAKVTDVPVAVAAVRDAVRVARALSSAVDAKYEGDDAIDAYIANRWAFTLNGERGHVWLTARDDLPRKIEMVGAAGTRTYHFADFDAAIAVSRPPE